MGDLERAVLERKGKEVLDFGEQFVRMFTNRDSG
jgi:hypothetical protein